MKPIPKVPIAYICLLAIAAGLVSFIGATFSVTGLAKLFSGAPGPVMFMAGSLEFAKIVSAGFLHQNWNYLGYSLRVYLSSAVFALITITSLGIFGYLSNAFQKSSVALKNTQIRIDGLGNEDKRIAEEIARMQKNIDEIPVNRVSKRLELQKQLEPEIQRLKKRAFEIGIAHQHEQIEKQGFQTEIGPLAYVAEAFDIGMDKVAKWLILLFVIVFDPLAICLVFATSWSLKTRRKENQPAVATQPVATQPAPLPEMAPAALAPETAAPPAEQPSQTALPTAS
jgi:hypothetical protein